MTSLVLATRNAHKLREFVRLLEGVELQPLPDRIELPPETGATYAENALTKARVAAHGTGREAIADDSGIEAQALGGAPGIRSARFAGEDATDEQNLAKLIAEAPAGSAVRYVCVIAHVDPAGGQRIFTGLCEGTLTHEPRGDRGFGYDPAFVPAAHPDRTMSELSDDEKDAVSHRGEAARSLAEWLRTR